MGFFGLSSAKRGRTHIVLGWNMSGASTSTYPENLGSGGQLPAELGGRVCFFCFFCPSRYVARHRKPRRCVYVLYLGETGIGPPDSFSYRSNFRFRSRSRSSSCTTSGDIFYCSGSRQLNHSSFVCFLFACPSRYDARHRKPRQFVYALNLGGTGISPPDNFSFRSSFRYRSRFRSRSSSSSTTSATYSIAAVAGNWTILV